MRHLFAASAAAFLLTATTAFAPIPSAVTPSSATIQAAAANIAAPSPVEKTGQTYRVIWVVAGTRYVGTGIGNKDFIAVSYKAGNDTGWRSMAPKATIGRACGPIPTAARSAPKSGARIALRPAEMDLDANRNLIAAALGRIPGGDRSALQTVYRLTSAKLFGVALRILGERSEAEDVLQEVYVTVWRKAADFDAEPGKPDDLADRDRAESRHRPPARHPPQPAHGTDRTGRRGPRQRGDRRQRAGERAGSRAPAWLSRRPGGA